MKTLARRLALLAVPLLCSAAVRAQELTQADKEKALQLLETRKKVALDATKDLAPAQWNFKSAPDRWSLAECMLKDTPGLRDHAVDRPVGTKWDAYEFILLIGAHSERHTKQIQEVKADPNFPKS
jgi:hypothetical protein